MLVATLADALADALILLNTVDYTVESDYKTKTKTKDDFIKRP